MEWVEVNLPWWCPRDHAESFEDSGMCRPGVQVEMGDGKRYLIGDINRLRGVCDDCTAFEPEDIVVRCRVLIAETDLEAP